jgi:ribonuclease I
MNKETKTLSLEEINEMLSDALIKVSTRKISLKQAGVISKLAISLTKNIAVVELKHKVEFIEQALKAKK